MEVISAEIYTQCPACGGIEWKIVQTIPKDAPEDVPVGKLPLNARCIRCGATATWLAIDDSAG